MIEEKRIERKTRKARTGLPQIDMLVAIDYTTKLYNMYGDASFSIDDLCRAIGVKKAFASRMTGEFKQYELLDQTTSGYWFVTDLGKRTAKGDKDAILTALQNLKIFSDLYLNFKDKEVTRGVIEDYLRKKWNGYNSNLVATRYLDVMNHIRASGEIPESLKKPQISENIIKLKYALNPPPENEIDMLIDAIYDEFKENPDTAIKTLVKSLKNSKGNKEHIKLLFENIIEILSKDYPSLVNYKEKRQKTSEEGKLKD